MINDFIAMFPGNFFLPLFNNFINKLDNLTGFRTHHMIMVRIASHFENRMTAFEIMTQHEPSRLKLGQNPIDSGQSHVIALLQQLLVNVFSTQVVLVGVLENIKNLYSWQSNFETDFP